MSDREFCENQRNLTMLTDLYQLTMMQGYFLTGISSNLACYDLFFRSNPFGGEGGYCISAGLESALQYIDDLKFSESDINYLRSLGFFGEDFLNYLRGFKFTGEIYAVKEGTVVFPNEPMIRVLAPVIEAQLIETSLLNIINHQSLIATKASRVVWAADGGIVSDFGLRRAQGADAGIYGSRAAYIGGCDSTSNVLASKLFGIPASGTQAHSWVMSFDSEFEAFTKYCELYPDLCTLLIDTYNVLDSGLPAAIKVFDRLKKNGVKKYGVRIDSGDLAYLSKKTREALDDAGHEGAYIAASGDLDEYLISQLKLQGAKIDVWGVGTKLITAYDCPALGGVYKLCAEIDQNGVVTPKIKISENAVKVTNPGIKKVYRITDKKSMKFKADLITLRHEDIDENNDLTLIDQKSKWRRMTLKRGSFLVSDLLECVYKNGARQAPAKKTEEIREFCKSQLSSLWDEYRRIVNPHIFPVDLSFELSKLKADMIVEIRRNS